MIETLKKAHADCMHAVQVAEREQENVVREWKAAIKAGADDAAIDAIDDRRRKAERTTERRRVAEQAAHDAVVQAEQAAIEQERQKAKDDFLLAHADFAKRLDAINGAAVRYREAVDSLPDDGGAWMTTMHTAKMLNALPSTVAPLPQPTDCQAAARKAANYPGFLQSRMH